METVTKEYTVYTAEELREHSPEGFERALNDYSLSEWEYGWFVQGTIEDFTDNVLTEAGLRIDASEGNDPVDYSIGNPNGGDYATVGSRATLHVDDYRLFADALRGRRDRYVADYFDKCPKAHVDLRSRLWRMLLKGDAFIECSQAGSDYYDPRSIVCDVHFTTWTDYDEGTLNSIQYEIDEPEGFRDQIASWLEALFGQIPEHAVKEYEYQTAPEQFIETSDANDWHYLANGKMFTK